MINRLLQIKKFSEDFQVTETLREDKSDTCMQVRGWLNQPGIQSHAHAILTHDTTNWSTHCQLSIADCTRIITLEFPTNNRAGLEESRYKLKQLKAFLNTIELILDEEELKVKDKVNVSA